MPAPLVSTTWVLPAVPNELPVVAMAKTYLLLVSGPERVHVYVLLPSGVKPVTEGVVPLCPPTSSSEPRPMSLHRPAEVDGNRIEVGPGKRR